jgi:uncharacterized membrane protein YciS (DUF1049 family)
MSEFEISPVTRCKLRRKPDFLSWLFAVIVIVETIASGYWFFRLNAQITQLKQQIETLQQINTIRSIENEVNDVQY